MRIDIHIHTVTNTDTHTRKPKRSTHMQTNAHEHGPHTKAHKVNQQGTHVFHLAFITIPAHLC